MKFIKQIPGSFGIYVKDKDDFNRVWALLSKVLKVTPNSIERSYKYSSGNNYIKYTTRHNYIWGSTMRGSDIEYRNFTTLEEFLDDYPIGEEVPKSTHDDILTYLRLSNELTGIDAEIHCLDTKRKEVLESLKEVKQKLNME